MIGVGKSKRFPALLQTMRATKPLSSPRENTMQKFRRARWRARQLILFTAACSFSAPIFAQVPAFSGADGAGIYTTGGRGGVVYHVTRVDSKVNDSGIGTLQYGCKDSNFLD